ncbi:hypothetical protein [Streptomyces sp. NPDC005438]|uniref:hypothetical protein n=1 Tax=Streptomyces sp. NPDC005438 TaxID=3156880 RepID=UPI0033AC7434
MGESWVIDGDTVPLSPEAVLEALRVRIDSGLRETWLTSSVGRMVVLVTNTERAMVLLLEGVGDPGEHAVDPGARGWSEGFVLSDGQDDAYPDEDTVPLHQAYRLVQHLVGTGSWPTDARWAADR